MIYGVLIDGGNFVDLFSSLQTSRGFFLDGTVAIRLFHHPSITGNRSLAFGQTRFVGNTKIRGLRIASTFTDRGDNQTVNSCETSMHSSFC